MRLPSRLLCRLFAPRDAFRCEATSAMERESIPRRWVMHPAAPEHRRHDLDLAELFRLLAREGIPVEDDEVGEEARHELAAAPLVARQPGRCERRRFERLLEGHRLLGMPGRPFVDRA